MDAFEHGRLAGDVIADRSLNARQVVRMHEAAPVRRAAHVVIAVAEHRLPARREVDLVAFDVEVPQAVVCGGLRERVALLELGESRLDADALETGGEARADELQHQLEVHVPRATRQSVREAEDAGGLALDAERDQQCRTDLQLREATGLSELLLPRRAGVAQLGKAQVIEPGLQPGKLLDAFATQRFRAALRERATRDLHVFDRKLVGTEHRDERAVRRGRFTQQLEIATQRFFQRLPAHVLEIDGDLRARDVETEDRFLSTTVPGVTGQDVRGRELCCLVGRQIRHPARSL